METKAFKKTNNGLSVFNNYTDEPICTVTSPEESDNLVYLLNDYEDKISKLTDMSIKLQEELAEKTLFIDTIFELIDNQIQENLLLAKIYYPRPEDEYVNEYESRATELRLLKEIAIIKRKTKKTRYR